MNYLEAMEYVKTQEAAQGKMRFRASEEYKKLYPILQALYADAGYAKTRKTRVEVKFCLFS